jgi:hypothetical protein
MAVIDDDDSESQAVKRKTLLNDARVHEQQQASTFHQYAQSTANDEAGGRFAAINAVSVVGAEPAVRYPAAAAHQRDPVPTEPPLGYCVDEMAPLEPSTVSSSFPVEETGDPAPAPSSGDQAPSDDHDVERTGSSPFSNAEE